jgi:hypothetical protein
LADWHRLSRIRSDWIVACGFEVAGAFVWRERVNELTEGGPEALKGALGGFAQQRVDGGQNVRAQIKGQRLGDAGRPPSPARTLNQIRPRLASPPIQPARMPL